MPTTAVLLAVLSLLRFNVSVLLTSFRAADAAFVALEPLDILSPLLGVRLLRFRPPSMLPPDFLSSVPGLLRSLALLLSSVLGALTLGLASRVSTFVLLRRTGWGVVLTGGFGPLIVLPIRDVLAGLMLLATPELGCFLGPVAGFLAFTGVAMRDVLAGLMLLAIPALGGFFVLAAGFAAFTGVAIRDVLAGLMLLATPELGGFFVLEAGCAGLVPAEERPEGLAT